MYLDKNRYRLLKVVFFLLIFSTATLEAEVFCPDSISVKTSYGTFKVGTADDADFYAKVTARLTSKKAICEAKVGNVMLTSYTTGEFPLTDFAAALPWANGLDYKIRSNGEYFDLKETGMGLELVTSWKEKYYRCSFSGSGKITTSDPYDPGGPYGWNGYIYNQKVRAHTTNNKTGFCSANLPPVIKIDFPRQTRPDNRDISVNFEKNGFYRVYDMFNERWAKLCRADCTENIYDGLQGYRYGVSSEYLNDQIQNCTDYCVNKGWNNYELYQNR